MGVSGIFLKALLLSVTESFDLYLGVQCFDMAAKYFGRNTLGLKITTTKRTERVHKAY